jgi:hypothetical protein
VKGRGLIAAAISLAACAQGVDSHPPGSWSSSQASTPDIDVEEDTDEDRDGDASDESGSDGTTGGPTTVGTDGSPGSTDPGGTSGAPETGAMGETSGVSMSTSGPMGETGDFGSSGMGEGSGGGPGMCDQAGWQMCPDGSGICIPPFWLCDGFNDCPSGADENAMACM